MGWMKDFTVSYVSLKSGGECPFDKLDLVYKAIVGGLLPPVTDPNTRLDEVKGIENFLRYWYVQRREHYRREGKDSDAISEAIKADIENLAAH